MPDPPRTIAEMFDATVARKGDQPALGWTKSQRVEWVRWSDLGEMVQSFQPVDNRINYVSDGSHSYKRFPWFIEHLAAASLGAVCGPSGELRPEGPIPDEIAALVPTSGTSGEPRTVALSHENLVSNTIAVAETIAASLPDEDNAEELRLSFLPFHHLYARVCDLYCWVYRGSRMVMAKSRETIFRDCGIVRPTTINGVPYFFQKAVDLADQRGVSLRELLGGRVQRCYSGGAALSPDLQRRYADEGVPLLNGYGLSEASPVVTVSTVRDNKPGTVGKPLPGVEVRIADESSETPGEVLVRGPNVMLGYWGRDGIDREATAEVLRDGWLHTGDLGQIDDEGFLRIVGRKKEIIALSTGKKASPSRVEALLAASPWIEQVAVVGEGRGCLGALIVPNPDRVRAEVRSRRLFVWSKRRALAHPAIREVFAAEIERCLAAAALEEQVRVFTLIPRAFSANRGEITAKLSLRRGVVDANFAREIERMYERAGSGAGTPRLTIGHRS